MRIHRTFLNLKSILFSFLFFLLFSSSSWAAVLYVATTGNDANNCSKSSKCLTIQRAIDVSSSGDTISIGAGTFTGANTLTDTSLSFEGAGAGTTIVDGGGVAVVFTGTFVGGTNNLSFVGMTIQNGFSGVTGGAIVVDCDFGTPTTVNVTGSNLLIQENHAGLVGSGFRGLQCANSNFNFSKSTFANNINNTMAVYGTSILNLTNVTFYNNTADLVPGAILLESGSVGNFNYVTFDSNTGTTDSGGIYTTGGTANSQNSIYNNNAPANCAINMGTIASAGHNISSDASCSSYFVEGTDLNSTDPVLGTYGDNGGGVPTIPLLSGSPAINTGNPSTCPGVDARDVTRPQGAGCDIGSFEVQAGNLQPSPSSLNFTDSTPQNVTITLDGIVPVNVSSVTITGTDAASFSFDSTDCVTLLIVGGSCTITNVTFLETASGSYSANIEIANDGGTDPTVIPLSGNISGGGGTLEANPTSLSFSEAGSQAINFSAANAMPVAINAATLMGADASSFSISTDDCSNTTVSSGTPCKITISFNATDLGSYTATLLVPNDGTTPALEVPLSGTIGSPSLSLAIEGPTASVASALSVGSTVSYKITVKNKGSGPAPDGTLSLALPPSLSYSSITAVQNVAALASDFETADSFNCSYANSVVTCPLGTLDADSTLVFELTTELVSSGSIEILGTLSSGSESVTAAGSAGVTAADSEVTGGCSLSLQDNPQNPILYEFILVLLLSAFYWRRLCFTIKKPLSSKRKFLERKKPK